MPGRALQQLLGFGEYDEFEDIVIVEGEFVEFDSTKSALRQVILGISPFNIIKANRHISDYKRHPEVYYNTEVDPYLDGLEIESIVPLCLLSMNFSSANYEIIVTTQGDTRYYLLCNTHYNGQLEDTWYRWVERVEYIHKDPYHYIRNMLDEHDLPYSSEYMEIENREARVKMESNRIKALFDIEQEGAEKFDGTQGHTNEGRYIIQGGSKKTIVKIDRKKRRSDKNTFSWKCLRIKLMKK